MSSQALGQTSKNSSCTRSDKACRSSIPTCNLSSCSAGCHAATSAGHIRVYLPLSLTASDPLSRRYNKGSPSDRPDQSFVAAILPYLSPDGIFGKDKR
jgi:hypothetical protein